MTLREGNNKTNPLQEITEPCQICIPMNAYDIYMARVKNMRRLTTLYILRMTLPFLVFLLLCLFIHYSAIHGMTSLLPVSHILWVLFCVLWFCALVSIFLKKGVSYREAGLICKQCNAVLRPWYLVADRQRCPRCGASLAVCLP